MDHCFHKHYHVDGFDAIQHYETFFSSTTDKYFFDEIVKFPCETLHKMCVSGEIGGDNLLDLSIGLAGFQLFPICDFFNDITVLRCDDSSIKELKKWINKDPDALDWSHISKFTSELEGDRTKYKQKEDTLRRKIKSILKCDFSQENLTYPVFLQRVDCVVVGYTLNLVCEGTDACHRILKKISSMIKLGGSLLLLGVFNATFYTVDQDKYRLLCYDEKFIRNVLGDVGFTVKRIDQIKSNIRSPKVQFEYLWVLRAVKEKEL